MFKERVSRVEEGIALLRGAWGDEPVTFQGKHFTVMGANVTSKPVHSRYSRTREPTMIELFFCTSVNVYKVAIAMEEMGIEYEHRLIDISKGEQHDPALLAGSPTGKLPVIRDLDPKDGGEPVVVFESGAILMYLAEKAGSFLPADERARRYTLQWLFWQVGNLGPLSGQAWHFLAFAPKIAPDVNNSYPHSRYFRMMADHWRVLDKQLAANSYVAGEEYGIADMACYPWIIYFDPLEGMDAFPNIKRWRDLLAARPALRRAYERARQLKTGYEMNDKNMTLFPWEDIQRNMIVN